MGIILRVTMPVFAQMPMLSGCDLMGYALGSHSEGWTAISTFSFPAMGKEVYFFMLQVPPWAGI